MDISLGLLFTYSTEEGPDLRTLEPLGIYLRGAISDGNLNIDLAVTQGS